MPVSDFPAPCLSVVRLPPSPTGPPRWVRSGRLRDLPVSAHETSVHAVGLRLRGLERRSRLRFAPCCLPLRRTGSAPGFVLSKLYITAYTCPCQRFAAFLTLGRRMTRGRGWSLAFATWRTFTSYLMPALTGAFPPFRPSAPHAPIARRSARRRGRPQSMILRMAPWTSYSTRRFS